MLDINVVYTYSFNVHYHLVFDRDYISIILKKKSMVENEVTAYIDPLGNFGFKRIFSSEPNKALLIAFLNKSSRAKNISSTWSVTKLNILRNIRTIYHRKEATNTD